MSDADRPIASGSEPAELDEDGWPWGFIVVVILAAIYVALRLIQMAGWVVDWAIG